MSIRGKYPNLMRDRKWLAWKREHWNDKVFSDAKILRKRLSALKRFIKSGSKDGNAKSWAIREGRETLSKMLVEEDKIYQGYYLPQRDKIRSSLMPASNERIITPAGERDHADWQSAYGPRIQRARDLGAFQDPYGPGMPDATDLGDGTSWVPASNFLGGETSYQSHSEFVGDVGFSAQDLKEQAKDNLWIVALLALGAVVLTVITIKLISGGAKVGVGKMVTRIPEKIFAAGKSAAKTVTKAGGKAVKMATPGFKKIKKAGKKYVKGAQAAFDRTPAGMSLRAAKTTRRVSGKIDDKLSKVAAKAEKTVFGD